MSIEYKIVEDLFTDEDFGAENYVRKTWLANGQIHRDDDLPAIQIFKSETNELFMEEWWQNSVIHREGDLPARVRHDTWHDKFFFKLGRLHRDAGPAYFAIDKGVMVHEEWYQDGKLSRDDGPAYVYRDSESGVAYIEKWYKDGQLHRQGGRPAEIFRNEKTGLIEEVSFYENGFNSELPEHFTINIRFEY